MLRFLAVVFLATSFLAAASSPFEESLALQRLGKLREARAVLLSATVSYRASADQVNLAEALSLASELSLSLGDYRQGVDEAAQAAHLREKLGGDRKVADDFNTQGLGHLYLGEYAAALSFYQRALDLDRKFGSSEGEITHLNNIGNVYYFLGRYTDALHVYQAAMQKVDAARSESWTARRRQLTLANLATLYQRLGNEQSALGLYRKMATAAETISPAESAQLLLNQGALYRRMGDPVKALQFYRQAQNLFAAEHHPDGEIGVLRNVGIARAVDFNDLKGALQSFDETLRLAESSSDKRAVAQANLYRAEVLRRLNRLPEAQAAALSALDAAQSAHLVEEGWKAEYALGKIAESKDQATQAAGFYEKAIASLESVRAGITLTALRRDFLADKRDVYDSLIGLRLEDNRASLFSLIERSRSRTFMDRTVSAPPDRNPTLSAVQARLPSDTVLLDFWIGPARSATLWINAADSGVVIHSQGTAAIEDAVSRWRAALSSNTDRWRDLSPTLGAILLGGVPLRGHLLIVPDGPLGSLPFEALVAPGSNSLLIERHDISYLPAAGLVLNTRQDVRWRVPWSRQMVAFADPPVSSFQGVDAEQWPDLPASADEARGIANSLPGRSLVLLGPQARKQTLLSGTAAGVPLLHFATHAVVDEENPDRSRVLLADDTGNSADYLFEQEVYNLDLHGVELATLSACDTARGKFIRGEGVEAFSRAFLAAGASAVVSSLWRVPDQPTGEFMKQFYYFLAQGQPKAQALRSAKLRFIRSGSTLSHPRYWAAFTLNGDGWNPTSRTLSWTDISGATVLLFALVAAALNLARRGSA